jgi:hypothetical protein
MPSLPPLVGTLLALCALSLQAFSYTLHDDDRLRLWASASNLFWLLAALGLHDLAGAAFALLGTLRGVVAVRMQGHARANVPLYAGASLSFAAAVCLFAWKDWATPLAALAGAGTIYASFCLQGAALRWGTFGAMTLWAAYWTLHQAPIQVLGALASMGALYWRARSLQSAATRSPIEKD